MAEFVYNNAKNASTGHTAFELNCGLSSDVIQGRNRPPLQVEVSGRIISSTKRADDCLSRESPPRSRTLKASPRQMR